MLSPNTLPPLEQLRKFKLGALPAAEAEQVEKWVRESPGAVETLRAVSAEDTLTHSLATLPKLDTTPSPDEDRLIRVLVEGVSAGQLKAGDPTQLGKYRIRARLGTGGMGKVYAAEAPDLGRRVALKVMHPELARNPAARQRFLREARAAAAIESDHIVTIHDVAEDNGVLFLVMEYLKGATLEEWLERHDGPVTAEEVMWVARDGLAGLAAAHAKQLVHRDVKPANLWVESDTGRLKVLDLGLARGPDVGSTLTPDGVCVGTPEYMAPEQMGTATVDGRADLFSLGVVLYQMASGISPFRRDNAVTTLAAVAGVHPSALDGVPQVLNQFIVRLMAKDRDARPANAAAALTELKGVEDALRGRTATRRSGRWQVAAGIAALVAMLAAGVIVIIRNKEGKPLGTFELGSDAANGGKVIVVDTGTGTTTETKIGCKPPIPGEHDRFTVIEKTPAFAADEGGDKYLRFAFVDRGATGVVIKRRPGKDRVLVRLDNEDRDELWIWVEKLKFAMK